MRKTAKLVTLLCATLCCGTKLAAEPGDFGRPRESIFADDYYPWLWDEYYWLTKRPPEAVGPYTDDERTLRNLAYAILLPAEDEHHYSFLTIAGVDFVELWHRWFAEPRPFDVQCYAKYLVAKHLSIEHGALWAIDRRHSRRCRAGRALLLDGQSRAGSRCRSPPQCPIRLAFARRRH